VRACVYGNQRAHCGNELEGRGRRYIYIGIYARDRDRSRGAGVWRASASLRGGGEGEREILITAAETAVCRRVASAGVAYGCVFGGEGMVGRCENAITRIVCVSAGRCECVRGARIITKYRELIKHIVGARRLDNRYKLPPRAKQLTGETRAYSTRWCGVAAVVVVVRYHR